MSTRSVALLIAWFLGMQPFIFFESQLRAMGPGVIYSLFFVMQILLVTSYVFWVVDGK